MEKAGSTYPTFYNSVKGLIPTLCFHVFLLGILRNAKQT